MSRRISSWGRRALAVAVSALVAAPLGLGVSAAAFSGEPEAPADPSVAIEAPVATEAPVEADAPVETDAPVEADAPVETDASHEASAQTEVPAQSGAPTDGEADSGAAPAEPTPADITSEAPVETGVPPEASVPEASVPGASVPGEASVPGAPAAAPTHADTAGLTADLVAEGIQPGRVRSIPIDVVNAERVRAAVVAPIGVDARLVRPDGSAQAWFGADREYATLIAYPQSHEATGQWRLEIRNGTDRAVDASYETSFSRTTAAITMSAITSLSRDRVDVVVDLRDANGPVNGAHIGGVLTGDNGIWVGIEMQQQPNGQYTWSSGVQRPGYYTVVVRTTIDDVQYSDVNVARIVGTDGTPPVMTAVTDPVAPGSSGWFTAPVTVNVTASDPAGIAAMWHRINGGTAQASGGETLAIRVADDGEHEVAAWAWDRLHNIAEPVITTVRLDQSAPEIETAGALSSGTAGVGQVAAADFACADPHSGTTSCALQIAGGETLAPGDPLPTELEGPVYYSLVSVNGAGLQTSRSGTLEVVAGGDETPPTIVVTTEPAASNARGWFRRDVTATITASDPGSGVAWVEYRTGGTEWTRVAGNEVDVPVTTDGATEIQYRAADNAGNITADRTRLIQLDRVLPSVRIDPSVDGVEVPVGAQLRALYTCGDDHSGILTCLGSTPYGAGLPTDTPGTYELSVNAVDRAGNETVARAEYTVLGEDPGPQLGAVAELSAEPNEHEWFKDPVTIAIRGIEGSGADTVHWELEGAQSGTGSAAGSGEVTVSAEGDTIVYYWAEDAEGGASEPVRIDLRIDRTAPVVTHGGHTPEALVPGGETRDAALAEPAATYELGERIVWAYSCDDELSGALECSSEYGSRELLPTDVAGTFEVTTTATDYAGNTATEVLTYEVVDPNAEPDPGPGDPGPRPGTGGPAGGGSAPDPRPASGEQAERDGAALALTGVPVLPILGALIVSLLAAASLLLFARQRRTSS